MERLTKLFGGGKGSEERDEERKGFEERLNAIEERVGRLEKQRARVSEEWSERVVRLERDVRVHLKF